MRDIEHNRFVYERAVLPRITVGLGAGGDGVTRPRRLALGILALVLLPACTSSRIVTIAEATVIGFAVEATEEDFERLTDRAVARDDFVTSWASFAAWAESAGLRAETAPPRFTIVVEGKHVRMREREFGYVFVEPSGRRRTIEGVQTDADLISAACAFFLTPSVQKACGARGEIATPR